MDFVLQHFVIPYKHYFTLDNLCIAIGILYTAMISIYTPRFILAFFNQPFIKLLVLIGILGLYHHNMTMAIVAVIAFMSTISLEQSISLSKLSSKPIIKKNREHFNNKNSVDMKKETDRTATRLLSDLGDDTQDEDIDAPDDNSTDSMSSISSPSVKSTPEKYSNTNTNNQSSSSSTFFNKARYNESSNDPVDDDADEDGYSVDSEEHDVNNPKLQDTFKNLHDAIHNLEKFISKNKKE